MGFEDRKIVFAGAGPRYMGTPWGTLGLIVEKVLAAHGYEVRIEPESFGLDNTRYVCDGRADLGATHLSRVMSSYHGREEFSAEPPRRTLRVIAAINHPSWLGVAVKHGSDITDLGQIAERRMAVRIKTGGGPMFSVLLEHYGMPRSALQEWGSTFLRPDLLETGITPWVLSGEFDVIVDTIYAAYTPEARHWWEASVLHELRFLALPDELIAKICAATGCTPGAIPHRLVRGIDRDVASVSRLPQVIYARDDTPEDFVYLFARALDDSRDLFRSTHLPYSYDPHTVTHSAGVPLHPGAARYYRDSGYLT